MKYILTLFFTIFLTAGFSQAVILEYKTTTEVINSRVLKEGRTVYVEETNKLYSINNSALYAVDTVNTIPITGGLYANKKGDVGINDIITVDSVEQLLTMNLRVNQSVYNKQYGNWYKVQADSTVGYVVDTVAVAPTLNGYYAKMLDESGSFKLEWFNVKYGAVDDVNKKSNWSNFKRACKYSILTRNKLIYNDFFEIYQFDKSPIQVNSKLELIGKRDTINVFPKYKAFRGTEANGFSIFEVIPPGQLILNKTVISSYHDGYAYETYNAINKFGGDVNTIKIADSVQIRNGFWSDLIGMDSVLWQRKKVILGSIKTISSFDSIARTIVFNEVLDGSNDEENIDTWIGVPFLEATVTDTADLYSHKWNTDNVEQFSCIDAIGTPNGQKGYIDLIDSHIFGFDYPAYISGYQFEYNVQRSKLQGNKIAIPFTGVTTTSPQKLILEKSEIHGSGTIVEASINSAAGTAVTNPNFGAGTYLHPGVQYYIDYCDFYGNNAIAHQSYSASGNFQFKEEWINVLSNCKFYDNVESPEFGVSASVSTYVQNTKFLSGGGAQVGKDITFENCLFKGPIIATNNYDPDDVDSLHYRLNVDKCIFSTNGSVNLTGWGGTQLNRMSCNITDCVFFMDDVGPKIQWRAGLINVTNAEIKFNKNDYSGSSNFSSFANYNGTPNDFTPAKKSRLIIDNANVQEYYNGGFITASTELLPAIDSVIIEVRNSDINCSEFTAISTTYKPLFINVSNSKIRNLSTRDEIKILSLREETSRVSYLEDETFRLFPTGHSSLKFNYDNVVNVSLDRGNTWIINTDGPKQVKSINITDSTEDWYAPIKDQGRKNLNHNFFGTINFISRDTLTLIPAKFDTTSNIDIADTLVILPNQRFEATSSPYLCLSDSTYLDTITVTLSAPANTREYQFFPNLGSTQIDPYVPGSISVIINGSEVGIDDENQTIRGAAMQGAISYLRGAYRLSFDTAPTLGDEIKIAVERYYRPYWIGRWQIFN